MAARYAGKYHRSPYPQATRIKNIYLLTILITDGGGDVLAFPPGQIFFLCWGRRLFLLGRHVPPPLLRTLDVGLNIAKK